MVQVVVFEYPTSDTNIDVIHDFLIHLTLVYLWGMPSSGIHFHQYISWGFSHYCNIDLVLATLVKIHFCYSLMWTLIFLCICRLLQTTSFGLLKETNINVLKAKEDSLKPNL